MFSTVRVAIVARQRTGYRYRGLGMSARPIRMQPFFSGEIIQRDGATFLERAWLNAIETSIGVYDSTGKFQGRNYADTTF